LQLEVNCVDCQSPCGLRSNLVFVCFVWSTFVCYFINHVVIVVGARYAVRCSRARPLPTICTVHTTQIVQTAAKV
jgi:hypothetical protein